MLSPCVGFCVHGRRETGAHLGEALPALSPRPLPPFSAFTAWMKFATGASKFARQSSMKTCGAS